MKRARAKGLDSFRQSHHAAAMNHVGGNRFSGGKLKLILGLLVCGLIGVGVAFQLLGTGESNDNKTFKLRDVSVFDGSRD